ncbi:hypothetical protein BDZ91DRAFT_713676 [Kalaharituber pfeilii]|nr:hypothetical protein BDZ91DRAFT_713676 [Kalaharituber pfeilii]
MSSRLLRAAVRGAAPLQASSIQMPVRSRALPPLRQLHSVNAAATGMRASPTSAGLRNLTCPRVTGVVLPRGTCSARRYATAAAEKAAEEPTKDAAAASTSTTAAKKGHDSESAPPGVDRYPPRVTNPDKTLPSCIAYAVPKGWTPAADSPVAMWFKKKEGTTFTLDLKAPLHKEFSRLAEFRKWNADNIRRFWMTFLKEWARSLPRTRQAADPSPLGIFFRSQENNEYFFDPGYHPKDEFSRMVHQRKLGKGSDKYVEVKKQYGKALRDQGYDTTNFNIWYGDIVEAKALVKNREKLMDDPKAKTWWKRQQWLRNRGGRYGRGGNRGNRRKKSSESKTAAKVTA